MVGGDWLHYGWSGCVMGDTILCRTCFTPTPSIATNIL